MLTETQSANLKQKYHVVSVELTDRPAGVETGKWYRYIIERGNSVIEGFKSGTLSGVTRHAENVADDLNERATRTGSTYAPRNTQKPAKKVQ